MISVLCEQTTSKSTQLHCFLFLFCCFHPLFHIRFSRICLRDERLLRCRGNSADFHCCLLLISNRQPVPLSLSSSYFFLHPSLIAQNTAGRSSFTGEVSGSAAGHGDLHVHHWTPSPRHNHSTDHNDAVVMVVRMREWSSACRQP